MHSFKISHLHVNDSLQVNFAAKLIWSFFAKPLQLYCSISDEQICVRIFMLKLLCWCKGHFRQVSPELFLQVSVFFYFSQPPPQFFNKVTFLLSSTCPSHLRFNTTHNTFEHSGFIYFTSFLLSPSNSWTDILNKSSNGTNLCFSIVCLSSFVKFFSTSNVIISGLDAASSIGLGGGNTRSRVNISVITFWLSCNCLIIWCCFSYIVFFTSLCASIISFYSSSLLVWIPCTSLAYRL